MELPLTKSLAALADPTRRRILQLLNDGDLNASEIGAHFDMSAPSISHHLKVLKDAELVQSERRGQTIVYSLNETVIQEVLQALFDLFEVGSGNDAE